MIARMPLEDMGSSYGLKSFRGWETNDIDAAICEINNLEDDQIGKMLEHYSLLFMQSQIPENSRYWDFCEALAQRMIEAGRRGYKSQGSGWGSYTLAMLHHYYGILHRSHPEKALRWKRDVIDQWPDIKYL